MVAHNYAPDDILRLVRAEAVAFRCRHPRLDLDDLESEAGEAVAEALARLAPDLDPAHRWNLVKTTIRSRLKDFARARKVGARSAGQFAADEDGNEVPHADPRADDPAERAAAREVVLTPGAGPGRLTPPDQAAAKVAVLRNTMFAAIRAEQVEQMIARLMDKAAAGDAAATKTVIQMLGGPSGPVNMTCVQIGRGDV